MNNPNICLVFISSLRIKVDNKIIKTGEDVYIIPIFAIVVVFPAINGNAPQIPQPIRPKKNSLKNSGLIFLKFFKIGL